MKNARKHKTLDIWGGRSIFAPAGLKEEKTGAKATLADLLFVPTKASLLSSEWPAGDSDAPNQTPQEFGQKYPPTSTGYKKTWTKWLYFHREQVN